MKRVVRRPGSKTTPCNGLQELTVDTTGREVKGIAVPANEEIIDRLAAKRALVVERTQ